MGFSANAEKQKGALRMKQQPHACCALFWPAAFPPAALPICSRPPAEQEPAERPSAVHAEPAPTLTGIKNRPAFWQTGYCVGVTYFCGQSPGNYRRRK